MTDPLTGRLSLTAMRNRHGRRVVGTATNYTLQGTDPPGTVFTNKGATGPVTFTLPMPTAALIGWSYRFKVVVDQSVTVAAAVPGTLLVPNNLAADALALATAGQRLGGTIEAECVETATNVFAWSAAVITAGIGAAPPPPSSLTGFTNYPPPTTGPYAYSPPYGTFLPGQAGFPARFGTYVDPVFGKTIKRLTANPLAHGGNDNSQIYVKNGWWNADSTYFLTQIQDSEIQAIQVVNGTTRTMINPGGASQGASSCDPVDPDVWYYFWGNELRKQLISTGAISVVKDFGAQILGANGSSLDWIDNTGRYMILPLDAGFRLWDKQADVLYAGTITDAIGGGYIAITPDAAYVILVNGSNKVRYAINHGTQTLTATGTTFFVGPSDHGDLSCPTDGNRYFVRCNNDTVPALLTKVNIATGVESTILTYPDELYWSAQPGHFSCASRGTFRDWVFLQTGIGGPTYPDDNFTATNPVATWLGMQNEILMVNILTGAIRRLAHHRSREQGTAYEYQPRLCASWDGSRVAWASNYGYRSTPDGYADIYCLDTPSA